MDLDIKIGREESGEGTIAVPDKFRKVSRHHAVVHWHDGTVSLEDKESANGTFVNGRRVAICKLKDTDTLQLGGVEEEDFKVDLPRLFATFRETEEKLRTDYSKEFEQLKQVYIDYQKAVAEKKKQATRKSQLPQRIATFVPAILGLGAFLLLPKDQGMELRIIAMSLGGVVSGVVGIVTLGKGSDMTEELTDLQIEYQKQYKCPKCGKEIPLTTHWKKLEAGGCCPYKCGAQYVVNDSAAS